MAKSAVETANKTLSQRKSEKAAAEAVVVQRETEYDLATKNLARGAGAGFDGRPCRKRK